MLSRVEAWWVGLSARAFDKCRVTGQRVLGYSLGAFIQSRLCVMLSPVEAWWGGLAALR